jgi:hypothetical protein
LWSRGITICIRAGVCVVEEEKYVEEERNNVVWWLFVASYALCDYVLLMWVAWGIYILGP